MAHLSLVWHPDEGGGELSLRSKLREEKKMLKLSSLLPAFWQKEVTDGIEAYCSQYVWCPAFNFSCNKTDTGRMLCHKVVFLFFFVHVCVGQPFLFIHLVSLLLIFGSLSLCSFLLPMHPLYSCPITDSWGAGRLWLWDRRLWCPQQDQCADRGWPAHCWPECTGELLHSL